MFDECVTKRTKVFATAREAGAYVDKHFGGDIIHPSYKSVSIKELEGGQR